MSRHPGPPPGGRGTRIVIALLAAALVVSGCADSTRSEPTASAPVSLRASPSADAGTPAAPVLLAGGTAADNLPLFRSVTMAVWEGPEATAGRAYIDALAAAGFDKTAMQVTPDQTTVGNAAESIQFSVRWGQECLVGQVGPATGAPVTVVVPVLDEGACLVGRTRAIDW